MTEFDLFGVGGQSNAAGRGTSANSPDPLAGNAVEYVNDTDTIVDPLDDPVGSADTGSAWPKFCVDYYANRGVSIAITERASGGTAQAEEIAGVDPHWDNGGGLSSELITYINNAITALENAGHTVNFRGILWHQGERDAQEIDNNNHNKTDYKTALEDMIERYRTEFGDQMPFWIFELGHENTGDTTGYQTVREAQQEVVVQQPYTYMVSDRQKEFPELGYMTDSVHYNQTGLNLMGEVGALNVSSQIELPTIQSKRATTTKNDNYIGDVGEFVVLTDDDNRPVIHDGNTSGGRRVAFADEITSAVAVTRDFETGDFTNWSGDTGNVSVDTTNPYEGTYSFHATGTAGKIDTTFNLDSYANVSWWNEIADVSADTTTGILIFDQGTQIIRIRNDDGGVTGTAGTIIPDETGSGGWLDTGIVLNNNTYYNISLSIDYANNQYDMAVEDETGTQIGTQSDISFITDTQKINEFNIISQSEESWVDLLELEL